MKIEKVFLRFLLFALLVYGTLTNCAPLSPLKKPSYNNSVNNIKANQTDNELIELDQMISSLGISHFPTFKQMIEQRYIRALVVYSKTDFFFDKGQPKGIQIDYLKAYEKYLNRNIKKESDKVHILLIPVTFNQLIPNLLAGKGDIAATYLTVTPKRLEKVDFASGGKMKASELIVTNKNNPEIRMVEDLSGKTVYALNGTSYIEHLEQCNKRLKEMNLPPIKIEVADPHLMAEDILEMVNSGVKDITIVDDYLAHLWQKILPDIHVNQNLALARDNKIGWAVRKENQELKKSIMNFAQNYKPGTLLGNILFKRYFKNTKWIKNPNTPEEIKKFKRFIEIFKKYGKKYRFDYLALMAQAYQESGLDQSKTSEKGAVGVMQLLPSTAADRNINISDIHIVDNNIHAGAKYLAFLRNRYYSKKEMSPVDQFAFSWAAYNAGPNRVKKMRKMAKKMGLDPNKWFNHVEIAAGKIVGKETVQYVANIYKYYISYKLSYPLEKP
ncbi:MAG: lytic transglycosylase F [Gammaproteobacteria bacterium]|nr:lytic transglycosylase F [Gammaproteobacteria bacterium]